MEAEKTAFWGIALKPGEPAELDLQDGETLEVTMASYGVELPDKHGRSVITALIRDSGKKYCLAALTAGNTETTVLNVSFVGAESLTFEVSGKNVVHLVGNFSFENEISDSEDSDDGNDLIDVYDEDAQMSDSDDDDDEQEPRLIVDNDPPIITELPDDDDSAEEEKSKALVKKSNKKAATPNGKAKINEKKGKNVSKTTKANTAKNAKIAVDEEEDEDSDEDEEENGISAKELKTLIQKAAKKGKKNTEQEDEDEEEEEEDEDEDEIVPAVKVEKAKISKKKVTLKDAKEKDEEDAENESMVTPTSAKSKRNKKRKGGNVTPEGPTPPNTKKSKIAQRPGTPAVVRAPPKDDKKESANGNKEKTKSTPAKNENPESGEESGSGKKKRRRSRRSSGKGGNKS